MQHFDYQTMGLQIRAELLEANNEIWTRLAHAGTWFDGKTRVAIATEVRHAYQCNLCRQRLAALSPNAIDGMHCGHSSLTAPLVDAIHRIVTDPARLTQDWVLGLQKEGISQGHYVEMLAIVVCVMNIDIFHRGLGLEYQALPSPFAGRPSHYQPKHLVMDGAWVSILPLQTSGTAEADLYDDIPKPTYVLRALSAVPDAVRMQRYLENRYYLPPDVVIDVANNGGRAISRTQIELVASRVSMNNQCFYCSSSHALLLAASQQQQGQLLKDETFELNKQPILANDVILSFVDAVMKKQKRSIDDARALLISTLGFPALVDIAALIGSFQRMNRIANATGVPLDDAVNNLSHKLQHQFSLRQFDSAKDSPQANKFIAYIGHKLSPLLFNLLARLSKRKLS